MKQYSRDKRSPKPSSEKASKTFSAIKAKDTQPEMIFRQILRQSGLTGYRLHWKIPGKPDIAFVGKKVAIFIHGCYWHRCPKCELGIPRSNSVFWRSKFEKNVARDLIKKTALEQAGWKIFTFWECDIKTGVVEIDKIKKALSGVDK